MKLNNILITRISGYTSIGFNTLSFIFGILYYVLATYTLLWNIFGVILIITFALNFFLVFYSGEKINKKSKKGNLLNILGYIYLSFSTVAVLLMNFGNLLLSLTYSNTTVSKLGYDFMVIFGFFGLISFGLFYSAKIVFYTKDEKIWLEKETVSLMISPLNRRRREVVKLILTVFSLVGLGIGFFSSISILASVQIRALGFFGIGVAQFGITWAFTVISSTIILVKIGWVKDTGFFYPLVIAGLLFMSICFFPYLATPFSINNAERNFDNAFNPAFGGDWSAYIDSEAERYLLNSPSYFLPLYFLGYRPKECTIMKDILYFNGSESSIPVDKDILLYFDAYLPLNDGEDLPGNNSILIRIHGGGWGFGDKGLTNMLQMNKYFASQGYIVFDIQYGLSNSGKSNPFTPEYVKGNFIKHDMIRHIGNFTYYLSQNANLFDANLDSVFVSGGSSGGHLACAAGLGASSSAYGNIISPNITVKGIIPFYPANNIYNLVDPYLNPALLVEADSPPCLVFQGTQDGLVLPRVSENLGQYYANKGNTNFAILYMPFAGHANDLYFSGYFNHVFLYFMERFMYLFR